MDRLKTKDNSLHRHLAGLLFPSPKEEIVEYVEESGAPWNIVELFNSLPRGTYRSESEVFRVLGVERRTTARKSIRLPRDVAIPGELPQFDQTPTLLIVAGKYEMVLYRAERGRMTEIAAHKAPRRHYSDDEGAFKVRTGVGTVRSGAPREIGDDEAAMQDFRRHIRVLLKNIVRPRDYDAICLFVPSEMKTAVIKSLPASFARKVACVIEGNLFKTHPLELLERLPKENSVALMSPEAKRLKSRAEQAAAVIRKKKKY
ncbi:DUF2795 domain-containing protein [Candidatus Parcubacteria bacterium]|nr:DUF2795 domain-containing protein [Candidatus Parcubacteria bacterium]